MESSSSSGSCSSKVFQKGIGPKKAFLSRIRSASRESLSEYYSNINDSSKHSGLDLLADVIAPTRTKSDSLCRSEFSAGSNLSLGLPDDIKNCLTELEENTLDIDDVDFTATPCDSPSDKDTHGITAQSTYNYIGEEGKLLPAGKLESDEFTGNVNRCSSDQYQPRKLPDGEVVDTVDGYTYNDDSYSANLLPETSQSHHVSGHNLDSRQHADFLDDSHSDVSNRIHNDSGDARYHNAIGDGRDQGNVTPDGLGPSSVSSSRYTSPGASSSIDWGIDVVDSKLTASDLLADSQVSTVGSTGDVVPKRKSSTPRRSSKSRKLGDILCQVCGDVAAGFYCGAYICEACKKFYMRAYKQEKVKYVCLRDKRCIVTKESRVQCQYCRYQKCLSLNMYSPKQGGEGAPPVKDSQMSEIPCRVCSAPSSGFHFGAITCEGCKGFYRRMAKERDPERYVCTKAGDCEINMITRNLCKACRYKRCTTVGMSIDGSRIGRQPNSVKHAISLELKGKGGTDIGKLANPVTIKQEPIDPECDSPSQSSKSGQWNDWMDSISEGRVTLESVPAIPNMYSEMLVDETFSEVESATGIETQTQYVTSHDTSPTQSRTTDHETLQQPRNNDHEILQQSTSKNNDTLQQLSSTNNDALQQSRNTNPETLQRTKSTNHETFDWSRNTNHDVLQRSKSMNYDTLTRKTNTDTSTTLHRSNGTFTQKTNTDTPTSPTTQFSLPQTKPVAKSSTERDQYKTIGKHMNLVRPESMEGSRDTAYMSGHVGSERGTEEGSQGVAEEMSLSVSDSKSEQMVKDIVEAGKCLQLLNYRVFDSNLSPGGFQVSDLMNRFRSKNMSPGETNDVVVDWSNYESKNKTWTYIMTAFNDLSYIALRFAKHLPGFHSLCLNDQVCLLQNSIYPVVLLNLSKSYDQANKRYNYFNFTDEEKEKIWDFFPMLQVFGSHFIHVGEMVKTFKLSDDEISLLSALLMYPSEINGLEKPRDVQHIQEEVTCALQHYEQTHHSDGLTRFGILLVRIAELVQCRLQHNLSLGLLLARNPDLSVPQLFHELIVDSFSDMHP